MTLKLLIDRLPEYEKKLSAAKASIPHLPWYPYPSLMNFHHFNAHFRGEGRKAFGNIENGLRIADIGAADGETSFFFESLGAKVTIVDYPFTNYNDCRGIQELKVALNSNARVLMADLDWSTKLEGEYDLAVFLGILYHLRNPMLVLNTICHAAETMLLSTVVFTQHEGIDVSDMNLSRLHSCREANNDPTNYWIFTPKGLRLVLKRSGWDVLDEFMLDDPAAKGHRMVCYCRRVPAWRDTRLHHDF